MAKKSARVLLKFECTVCHSQNFTSEKNKLNVTEKLVFNKFCPRCRKYTEHKETQKMK